MVVVVDTVSATPLRPRHPEKVNRPDALSPPKPDWIRVRAPNTRGYADTRNIVKENGLVTVCEEAGCPNIGECWDKKHATFMIMGDTCTRACAFCNVKTGMPGALDALEPEHVAEATFKLGLAHIVITSVDRDDLADGGAEHFAQTIRAIRARCPTTTIEILTPDFLRKDGALEIVVAAKPDVFNHNLETVPSRYLTVRPGARYFHSIRLLQRVKEIDPDHLHQVRHHGRPRRGAPRGAAGDGRSALGGCRFSHHRAVSAADPQASRRDALRHRRMNSRLREGRLHQGLPDGVGEPADPLVASRRRRFRQAAGGARGAAALSSRRCRNSPASAGFTTAREQMFDLVADVERYPEFVPLCQSLKIRQRTPKPDGTEIVIADMTVSFKLVREAFTSRVTLDRPNLKILVEYLQGPFSNLENRWTFEPKSETACDVGFFLPTNSRAGCWRC